MNFEPVMPRYTESMQTLILLPGMDGTGELFLDFLRELPDEFEPVVVRYPIDQYLSYSELLPLVRASCPLSESFVLVAESYSTPLAIQYAAMNPANLKGLVLCAGFTASPVKGWMRYLARLVAPVAFRIPLPAFAAKYWLVGSDAPWKLISSVLKTVSSVKHTVLATRARAVLTCNVVTEMSQISVPVLYIQAKQDRLVSTSSLKDILRINSNVKVAVINGPHLILQRKPHEASEIIGNFIQALL
jgi:pimeloyl-[acyl-carrier protein] methyl ester esterase